MIKANKSVLCLLTLICSLDSYATEKGIDKIFYESEGVKVLPADPLNPVRYWCRDGYLMDSRNNVHTVTVFYSAPHSDRLKQLASSYEKFIKNIILPAVRKTCERSIENIRIIMRRSNFAHPISVNDILYSQAWDYMEFDVTGSSPVRTKYRPLAGKKHMSQAQINALKPKPIHISNGKFRTRTPKDTHLLSTTLGEFKYSKRNERKTCKSLPPELTKKLWGTYEGLSLSDDEFLNLVGDTLGFFIPTIDYVYSRKQAKLMSYAEFFNNVESVAYTINSTNDLDDFPVLCGTNASITAAQVEEEKRRAKIIKAKKIERVAEKKKIKIKKGEGRLISSKHTGTVVKTNEFWARLQVADVIRDTFEGDFYWANSKTFRTYYFNVQLTYSNNCAKYLSKNAIRRGITQTNSDPLFDDVVYPFWIDPQFVSKYDEYASKALRETEKYKGIFNVHKPMRQIERFIKATGCESAAMYQLRENFLRAANSRSSLQQDKVVIKNANKESMVPVLRTLYGACRETQQGYSNERYCLCFESRAKRIMTPKELKYFTEDFLRFYDATKDIQEKPARDRVWALYKVQADCMR